MNCCNTGSHIKVMVGIADLNLLGNKVPASITIKSQMTIGLF